MVLPAEHQGDLLRLLQTAIKGQLHPVPARVSPGRRPCVCVLDVVGDDFLSDFLSGFLSGCRDVMCGKLFCHNGMDNPNYGRMVRINDCKASFFDDFTKDVGQVDTGTKCGDGKVSSAAPLRPHCVGGGQAQVGAPHPTNSGTRFGPQ